MEIKMRIIMFRKTMTREKNKRGIPMGSPDGYKNEGAITEWSPERIKEGESRCGCKTK